MTTSYDGCVTTETSGSWKARQIAEHVAGVLQGDGDAAIHGVAGLAAAGAGQLTIIAEADYSPQWARSGATAALVRHGLDVEPGEGRALIFVRDVDIALARVLERFAPPTPLPPPGVHPAAIVDSTAVLGRDCRIGPHVYIGPRVTLGERCVLHAGVSVFDDATVGDDTTLWSGVVIRERCTIGRRCLLHPNVTVGADGFGFRREEAGAAIVKVPQIGVVRIGDDVEIGAGSCIDRARLDATIIGDGCKIDNLVQIGHNCRIGARVIIAGQAAIAGSVTIGDATTLGGAVVVADHVTIGAGSTLAGGAAVMADVPDGQTWAGYPAMPYSEARRHYAAARRLPDLVKQLRQK